MTDTPQTDALRENVIAAVRDFLAATNTAAVSINMPGAPMQRILAGEVRSVAKLLELDTIEDNGAARIAELEAEVEALRVGLSDLADEFVKCFAVYYYSEPWAHNKNQALRNARALLPAAPASEATANKEGA